ncbi:hypothetical protein [Methanococcoides sp.]|uniref:hypothetical protein n=1 Tax=Methanococcoides sp. TaxID=1966350 RepID=UPI00272E82AB|nr:hypothetical protein [Methanococcoides sp.]
MTSPYGQSATDFFTPKEGAANPAFVDKPDSGVMTRFIVDLGKTVIPESLRPETTVPSRLV